MNTAKVEVYELKYPIEFAGKRIEKVNVRTRTRVKDWKPTLDPETGQLLKISDFISEKGNIAQEGLMILAPRLTDLLDAEWDSLDMEDGQEIMAIVLGFLAKKSVSPAGEAIGMTASQSSPTDSDSQQQS